MNINILRHTIREILSESNKLATINELGTSERQSDNYAKGIKDLPRGIELTKDQALDILQTALDVIGVIPGPGDVADLVNASIYVARNQYALAAISILCMIPAIGSAFGVAKLAGKTLSAKIIFEHADKIEALVKKITPEIPNGEKVAEAVRKILSDIKMGGEGIDIATGNVVKAATKTGTDIATTAASKWYANPEWQKWFMSIIKPNLTKVLNEATSKRARNRLIKTMTKYNVAGLKKIRTLLLDPALGFKMSQAEIDDVIKGVLERNTTIAKAISDNFHLILQDLKQNLRFRIIAKPDEALKLEPNIGVLAYADSATNEVVILLPRFWHFIDDIAELSLQLSNTIKHEVWHIIDFRLATVFKDMMKGSAFSGIDEMADVFEKLIRNFDLKKINDFDYISDPSELFVRVKAMKEFLRKTNIEAGDLMDFSMKNLNEIPVDIKYFHKMMQDISDDAFNNLADAMNDVL